MPSDYQYCQYCGQGTFSGVYSEVAHEVPAPSRNVTLGGLLILASGILGVFSGIYALVVSDAYSAAGYVGSEFLTCCAVIIMLFSGVAVLGGLFAIQRRHFTLAVIGGVLGMIVGGFWIGLFLGAIGLILVAPSRNEFRD